MPTTIKNDPTYFNVTPTGIRDIRIGETGRYRFTVKGCACPNSGHRCGIDYKMLHLILLRMKFLE